MSAIWTERKIENIERALRLLIKELCINQLGNFNGVDKDMNYKGSKLSNEEAYFMDSFMKGKI